MVRVNKTHRTITANNPGSVTCRGFLFHIKYSESASYETVNPRI